VTTQPPSPSAPAASPAAQTKDPVAVTAPLREWGALLLVVATAAFLLFALVDMVLAPDGSARFGVTPGFAARADAHFGDFVGLVTTFFPLVAVLLATHPKPASARAKLITLLALIDYGVAGLLGLISVFVAFFHQVTGDLVVSGFLGLLERLVWLAVFAFAGFVTLRIYLGAYVVPRPKPVPGVYGYPTYQGYPQQAGYPQGYPQQGYPPQYPAAAGYPTGGYPVQQPPAPAPTSVPPSTPYPAYAVTPPSSAPPADQVPSAPPATPYPTSVQPGWAAPGDTPSPPAPPTAAAYAAQTGYPPQPPYPQPPPPAGPGYVAQPTAPIYQPPAPPTPPVPSTPPAPPTSAPPVQPPTAPFDVATEKAAPRPAPPEPAAEPPTEANPEPPTAPNAADDSSDRTQALPPRPPTPQPGDEPTQRWG
jgi:hypothetical protein